MARMPSSALASDTHMTADAYLSGAGAGYGVRCVRTNLVPVQASLEK